MAVRVSVRAAVLDKIKIASVSFGIESVVKAAEFNKAFMDGKPPPEACIVVTQDADPVSDRYVRRAGAQQVTFVMTDERNAAEAARDFAEQGAGLIELYGDFTDETAAAVIEAVAGRTAVGVSGFRNPNVRNLSGAMA